MMDGHQGSDIIGCHQALFELGWVGITFTQMTDVEQR